MKSGVAKTILLTAMLLLTVMLSGYKERNPKLAVESCLRKEVEAAGFSIRDANLSFHVRAEEGKGFVRRKDFLVEKDGMQVMVLLFYYEDWRQGNDSISGNYDMYHITRQMGFRSRVSHEGCVNVYFAVESRNQNMERNEKLIEFMVALYNSVNHEIASCWEARVGSKSMGLGYQMEEGERPYGRP